MSPISEAVIARASDDELFRLLGVELERLLPDGRSASDAFVAELRRLPVGLRAMAATYELDVSLTLDDLGWHFGNWHHEGLALETAAGLDELGMAELAAVFRQALSIAQRHWQELGEEDWSDWYHSSEAETAMMPLNDIAWKMLSEKRGILSRWVPYARTHPDRLR